jgi:hypothetical protein
MRRRTITVDTHEIVERMTLGRAMMTCSLDAPRTTRSLPQ